MLAFVEVSTTFRSGHHLHPSHIYVFGFNYRGDEGKVELSIIESLNDFDELFGGEVNRNEFKVHAVLPSLPLSSFVTWCGLMWR